MTHFKFEVVKAACGTKPFYRVLSKHFFSCLHAARHTYLASHVICGLEGWIPKRV